MLTASCTGHLAWLAWLSTAFWAVAMGASSLARIPTEAGSTTRFFTDVPADQRPRAVLFGASLVKAIAIAGVTVARARMAAVQHLLARLLALGH